MDFFTAMKIGASGLSVQRTRMNITASNLANVDTTRTAEGGAYKPRHAIVAAVPLSQTFDEVLGDVMHDKVASAEVVSVQAEQGQGRMVYDPQHPDANGEGNVEHPNLSVVGEMTKLSENQIQYRASTAFYNKRMALMKYAITEGSGG